MEEPSLILHFQIKNKDERKVLTFSGGNDEDNFTFVDDVGNDVHGSFRFMDQFVGTFFGDIAPGVSEAHAQAYSVPLPKTEHLILTVDLSSCDGEGKIEFKIPATEIEK